MLKKCEYDIIQKTEGLIEVKEGELVMRKIKLFGLLCVCILVLSSCAGGGKLPVERKQDTSKDKIKPLGLEWLTERKDFEKKLAEEFGGNNFIGERNEKAIENNAHIIDDNHQRYHYTYKGEDDKPIGEVAGKRVDYLTADYISNDNGKTCYIIDMTYHFYASGKKELDLEGFKKLGDKLKELYTITKEETADMRFTDDNNNELIFLYIPALKDYGTEAFMSLDYNCKEVEDIIWDEYHMPYLQKKSESKDGL